MTQLFQSRTERLHQITGKVSDEANGISYDGLLIAWKAQSSTCGIQSCKKTISHLHPTARQRIEQRGFSRIGVANDGNDGKAGAQPQASSLAALFLDLQQLLLQPGYAISNPTSVDFQLGLTRPPTADATCEPRQSIVFDHQSRQQVLQLCHLHLYLSFPAFGPLGKNVQDKLSSVDNSKFGKIGNGAHL